MEQLISLTSFICFLITCSWYVLVVFFFSSRRRHTRCSRDWRFRRVLFRSLSLARSPFPPLEVSAADFHTRSAPGVLRRSSGTPVSRRTADTLAGTHPPSAWRPPGCRASGGPPRARAWPRLPERQCAATRAAGHCSAHSTACLHRAVEQAAVDAKIGRAHV